MPTSLVYWRYDMSCAVRCSRHARLNKPTATQAASHELTNRQRHTHTQTERETDAGVEWLS